MGGSSNNKVQESVLATMLNEMDGVGTRLDTKLDASRDRQVDDGQMIRPGGLSSDKHLYSVSDNFG